MVRRLAFHTAKASIPANASSKVGYSYMPKKSLSLPNNAGIVMLPM